MRPGPHDGVACRVTWVPGGDDLHSTCSCGATRTDNDPAGTWDWFSTHLATEHPDDGRSTDGRGRP